jgi:hypothetical protein
MTRDPILAARTLPAGTDGYRVPLTFVVEGGLHYIKGNSAPYFSLTYTQHRKGFPEQCYSGGAGHDAILRYFPRFADLAALHLSDIDGAPMHAEQNGWYWLAGALGGADERYHGGGFHDGGVKSESECLAIFAKHCRITLGEADRLRDEMREEHFNNPDGWKAARATWALRMDDMRPRWKAEAEAAIARHSLRVYGDPWTREEVEA